MRLRLVGVVEEHIAATARDDLVAPGRELRPQLGERADAQQLETHEHMYGTDVRRHVTRRADVIERALERKSRAFLAKGHHRTREGTCPACVPERAARERRH